MGIKGLMDFLRKRCPQAIGQVPLTHLQGKKIAVDAFFWMYNYLATAQKNIIMSMTYDQILHEESPNEQYIMDIWVKSLTDFIKKFLEYDITLIFVFDGEAPIEKTETRKGRQAARDKSTDKITNLREALRGGDELDDKRGIVNDMKKYMASNIFLTGERVTFFRSVLKDLGVPVLQATGEGEQLCSMLCIEGSVDAVISNDTDNLAMGCTLLLTDRGDRHFVQVPSTTEGGEEGEEVKAIEQYKYVSYPLILQGLELSPGQFRDLCIMSGCDFNTNIKNIAIVKSYNSIKKVSCFKELKMDEEKSKCLNYDRCSELFAWVSSKSLIESEEEIPLIYDTEAIRANGKKYLASGRSLYVHNLFIESYDRINNLHV